MPQTETAISFEDVSFSHDGKTWALREVCFDVPRGQFVALVGGNGSGKSTVTQLACALLLPGTGRVRVLGADTAEAPFDARRHTGVVFQNPDEQIVASIVENEVAFGPENLGVPAGELRARVTEALELVGLAGFEQRETNALSGGQKQRLALAGALAMRPEVLILDEATSMLDPAGRRRLMEVVSALHARGMTILMVTHAPEEAALAERVLELRDGRVVNDELHTPCRQEKRPGGRQEERATPARTPVARTPQAAQAAPAAAGEDDLRAPAARGCPPEPTSAAADALVAFLDASYRYGQEPEGEWALRDIYLSVERGDFLAVVGGTGSGKSTLVQHMNGLVHPTEGRVLFCGRDLREQANANEARLNVGVVFQYPERQLFAPTVYDDVAFGPRAMKLGTAEVDERVRAAMADVDLDFDRFNARNPFHLSGGEQRRAAIAGVLAMRTDVLVLDEPCAGLDAHAHADMVRLMKRLHEAGRTIVMVSHDMDDVDALATRVVRLKHGRMEREGAAH